jgi:hypothetical protein
MLDEYCGDSDACTIRLVSRRTTTNSAGDILADGIYFAEEWQFFINDIFGIGQSEWGVHGTWRSPSPGATPEPFLEGNDGNRRPEEFNVDIGNQCSVGDGEIEEIAPGEYQISDTEEGVYLMAVSEDLGLGFFEDATCHLWIFD